MVGWEQIWIIRTKTMFMPYGENFLKEINIQKTIKHGGGNIMTWGCFVWSSVGNLAQIKGIITDDVLWEDFFFLFRRISFEIKFRK